MGIFGLLTLLCPLLGALVLGLAPWRRRTAGLIGFGSIVLSLAAAVAMALTAGNVGRSPIEVGMEGVVRVGHNWVIATWVAAGSVQIPIGLWIDGLSVIFALVITGVGLLITIYSLGYMAGENDFDYRRYFAGIDLFIAAMLLLVLADNYVLLLVGWAGVGFASYLLIGFWYQRPAAVAAARKAFILNTVGDVALILAVAIMMVRVGNANFAGILGPNPHPSQLPGPFWTSSAVTWVGLLLFVAAAAKSAQFPLQSWLSDAMEGPTPVSALIHAATMVTAGVYLIARSGAIFAASPLASGVAGDLAALTALGAALAAVAAYDLKRALAYSTMSQVGYMISAVAFGAVAAGVSHVITHAFFKALLFLSAGIVMHATADERDMRRYGGLGKHLPLARLAFLVGVLALAGIPPFAGFWSKDAVLGDLLAARHVVPYALLAAAAFVTPLYAFRMYYLTFGGERRSDIELHTAVATSMRWPTWILAVLATGGGAFAVWLQQSWGSGWHWSSMAVSIVLALAGWGLAFRLYGRGDLAADGWMSGRLGAVLRSEYGWDDLGRAVIVEPAHGLGNWLVSAWEEAAWPRAETAVAGLVGLGAGAVRIWQSGLVRRYALTMVWGAAVLLVWAIVRR